jgi:hypothetical protein
MQFKILRPDDLQALAGESDTYLDEAVSSIPGVSQVNRQLHHYQRPQPLVIKQ